MAVLDENSADYLRNRERILAGHPSGAISEVIERKPDPRLGRQGIPCPSLDVGWMATIQGGLSLVDVLRSSVVPGHISRHRDAVCDGCRHATVYDGKPYCQCCGCGAWSGLGESSDCHAKNKHAAWSCPAGKFAAWSGDTIGRGVAFWKLPALAVLALIAKRKGVTDGRSG